MSKDTEIFFITPKRRIGILVTENCLEIGGVLKIESLEACKGKKAMAALKSTKIQIFSFREEKCFSVWSYDKNISIFWQKCTFTYSNFVKGSEIFMKMGWMKGGKIPMVGKLKSTQSSVHTTVVRSDNY